MNRQRNFLSTILAPIDTRLWTDLTALEYFTFLSHDSSLLTIANHSNQGGSRHSPLANTNPSRRYTQVGVHGTRTQVGVPSTHSQGGVPLLL